MAQLDLRKALKQLYAPSAKEAVIVEVPPLNFLMIDGRGDPNTAPEYTHALETLYGLAYTLKFKVKKQQPELDYAVMPLEGLWWADDMSLFSQSNKQLWRWTMMIAQPEYVTADLYAEALQEFARKKGAPALDGVRLERFHEGRAAQIMHIGPYNAEAPTIIRLHGFIAANGYTRSGKHHEIYLKDPRRSAPEKLLTIIRQPIA